MTIEWKLKKPKSKWRYPIMFILLIITYIVFFLYYLFGNIKWSFEDALYESRQETRDMYYDCKYVN